MLSNLFKISFGNLKFTNHQLLNFHILWQPNPANIQSALPLIQRSTCNFLAIAALRSWQAEALDSKEPFALLSMTQHYWEQGSARMQKAGESCLDNKSWKRTGKRGETGNGSRERPLQSEKEWSLAGLRLK